MANHRPNDHAAIEAPFRTLHFGAPHCDLVRGVGAPFRHASPDPLEGEGVDDVLGKAGLAADDDGDPQGHHARRRGAGVDAQGPFQR